ncbi:hypothetical protein BC941DRAFT_468583 [Chlamydoabsidia padenii]|nr:hypothetical protein BC941DRAFT_468583 [Chlamydoabsidia padenii]
MSHDPSTCWKQTAKKCIDIINEANSSEGDTDSTAGSILFCLNESSCENTFVHHYLVDALDGYFSQEALLQQEWLGLGMGKWMVGDIQGRKFDLAACEVKPPNKSVSSPLSDFVKLGVEMQKMLMALRRMIGKFYALGILVEGKLSISCVARRKLTYTIGFRTGFEVKTTSWISSSTTNTNISNKNTATITAAEATTLVGINPGEA